MSKTFAVEQLGPCPRARDQRGHAVDLGGLTASLDSYGRPDLAVTVQLGRCRACGVALLAVAPSDAEDLAAAGVLLQVTGAEVVEQ